MAKKKEPIAAVANEKGVTRFNCPNCGKPEIVRTKHQKCKVYLQILRIFRTKLKWQRL